ncbi:MAG TPA: heme exporter protein CcmD [Rhizobiales bacterium]|nr:heme exporter protein CcmD [Hyphomicrobiales bacterium]
MDFTAKHIGFVLACYGISAVMLLIMSLAIVIRSKRYDRQLARLEQARGKRKAHK